VYCSEEELERKGLKLKILRCYPLTGTVSPDKNGPKHCPFNLLCSTYDGQELLDVLDGNLGLCPAYFPPGQECTLPLNPGAYGSLVGGDLYIVLPEIANELSKYIYQTHTRITYCSQCVFTHQKFKSLNVL
jgi:hypothetical protein